MTRYVPVLPLAVVFFGLVMGAKTCQAEEPAEKGFSIVEGLLMVPKNLDLKDKTDQKILEFCREAILHERGVAWSPFYPPTDGRIAKRLASNKHFLKALDDSTYVFKVEPPLAEVPKPPKEIGDIIDHMQRKITQGEEMKRKLTDYQRYKLPAVYLHLEGFAALCRPEFEFLLEKKETVEAIRKLYEEAWEKKASPIGRGLFTLREPHEGPLLHFGLRAVAYEVDCQIVELLSKSEREKLVEILDASDGMQYEAIHSAPY
jgi:hypothetical protein